MNDEEVVVPAEEQAQEEQTQQSVPKQSALERAQGIRDTVDSAGKTLESIGKGEEKVADWMDGSSKVTKGASEVGSVTSSAASTAADAGEKAAQVQKNAADATEKAAQATKQAAQATKAAAETGKAASTAMSAAGDAANAVGTAADATGVGAPIGVPLNALGTAASTAGKIGEGAATATAAGADAAIAGADATIAGAKAAKGAAEAEMAAAKATKGAAEAGKKGSELGKKASDANSSFADKLRKNGKFNQAQGKRLQDAANKFSADKLFKDYKDKLGKAGDAIGKIGKLFGGASPMGGLAGVMVVFLLFIIVGSLLVSFILAPMFFMKGATDTANTVEKLNNFAAGLGFKDSEQAFYDEVDYLKRHYNDKLDFTYIMSTLYYTDIFYEDTSAYTSENESEVGYQLAVFFLELYKEATTTTGDDGLVYSASKLYRLRDLAKHQFISGSTDEKSLSDYIEYCKTNMNTELTNMFNKLPEIIFYLICYTNPGLKALVDLGSFSKDIQLLIQLLEKTESWESVRIQAENGYWGEAATELKYFLEAYFGSLFNIKSVSVGSFDENLTLKSLTDSITIEYYTEQYSEEKFEDYLVDEYIPNMPEFQKLLLDKDGNKLEGEELEKKSAQIASEIKALKDLFDSIYATDESAQEYGKCIGDIDLYLLNELTPPVDLSMGQTITFSSEDNYGLYTGIMHNGVDLNQDSVGVTEGSNVYSVYNGVVTASTVDDTFYDKTANGGWLVIDYVVQYENSSLNNSKLSKLIKSKISTIRVYYGGLNPNDLTLKKGDTVNKGDVIGHIGDATASEDGNKPSLHFGVYDVKKSTFLNPVNMFITCSSGGTSSVCQYDLNGGVVIDIPDAVTSYPQVNYDVECYSKELGWGCNKLKPWKSGTNQRQIYDLWVSSGAHYTNGIATLNVNGEERYLAATTIRFGQPGDIINATLANGEVIHIVIDDTKDYCDTITKLYPDPDACHNNYKSAHSELDPYCASNMDDPGCFGHYKGSSGVGILEFAADPNEYNNNPYKSPSKWGQIWDASQKVVSITNYGSIIGSTSSGQCTVNAADPSLNTNVYTTENTSSRTGTNTEHHTNGSSTNNEHNTSGSGNRSNRNSSSNNRTRN